jgi:hypothetical protein
MFPDALRRRPPRTNTTSSSPKKHPVTSLVSLAIAVAIASGAAMSFHLPPLLARLARTFTQSSFLSVAPDASSGAAAGAIPDGAQRCTVAAGCFWGTEHLYRKHFAGKGLLDAKVGYIGGDLENPSYRAVCGGRTGREY